MLRIESFIANFGQSLCQLK